jgi:hypothetical protein
MNAEELRVYPVGNRRFVYAPEGRGKELQLHLASHGIPATVAHVPEVSSERLELPGDVDVGSVQALLDHWER